MCSSDLGNIASPFFGGITATAAIARSAVNVKSGGVSPISSVVHALLVLFALLFFAPALSYLPLSSMAALLLVVAWHMADLPQIIQLTRRSGRNEIAVLLVCLILTVLFDMVIAISVGVSSSGVNTRNRATMRSRYTAGTRGNNMASIRGSSTIEDRKSVV